MKVAEDLLLAALVAVSLGAIGLSTSGWRLGSAAPETVVASASERSEVDLPPTAQGTPCEPRLANAKLRAITCPRI